MGDARKVRTSQPASGVGAVAAGLGDAGREPACAGRGASARGARARGGVASVGVVVGQNAVDVGGEVEVM